MKIVALAASPSHGRNSDSMLDSFIAGMHASDLEPEIHKYYLDEIQVDHYHYENRLGPTEHEIDFKKLCEDIKTSDALVIATPTYNFSVPAQLKNFIDRIRFFALDLETKNSIGQPSGKLGYLKTYYLVSGGTPAWAQRILFFAFPPFWLRGVFLYYGADCMGALYSGDIRTFENKKILNDCMRRGRRFANKVAAGKRHSILERIFWRPPQKEADVEKSREGDTPTA